MRVKIIRKQQKYEERKYFHGNELGNVENVQEKENIHQQR